MSPISKKIPRGRYTSEKPEKEVNVKKHDWDMGNEIIKVSETPCFLPNAYGDRFIPRRYNCENQHFIRPTIKNCNNQPDNDIFFMKNDDNYWRRHEIKQSLESDFKHSREKVLMFHDWITKEVCKKSLNQRLNINRNVAVFDNVHKFDWPCSPRRVAIATTEISHVISNYIYYSHLNVISWSSTGNLAASFGKDLVLWVPKGKSLLTYDIKGITSLAYNNDGKYIAIGVKVDGKKFPQIQIWDVSSDSIGIFVSSFEYTVCDDEVRCIIWDPKTTYIVSGTLNGHVYIHKFNSSLEIIATLPFTKCCVKDLKLSANQKLLAASDGEGNVYVWNVKSFELIFHWNEKKEVKTLISWHPWKGTFLIISSSMPASISLIDVKAKKMIAYYNRPDKLCRIDAITFNPKSAELVVSVTMFDDLYEKYEILVLASLDRVVDLLNIHDGCVSCLLWNHDGTMLATAGDDDMLNIWNFFGHSQPVKRGSGPKCATSKFTLANPNLLR